MSAPKRIGAKTLAAAVGSLVWVFSSMAVSANPGHGVAASTDAERLATAVLKVGRYYEKDRRTRAHTRYSKRPHGRHTVEAPFTYVETDRGRVVVDAPLAFVKRSRRGVRVRAPFVDLYIPH